MKALPALLRIAKRDLDLLRRELAELETRRAEAISRLAAHEEAVASEQRLALQHYEAGRAYGGYAAVALAQRRAITLEIAAFDAEGARIRALLGAAHVEVRKFERLLELEVERTRVAEAKLEAAEMDEIATLRAALSYSLPSASTIRITSSNA